MDLKFDMYVNAHIIITRAIAHYEKLYQSSCVNLVDDM
jgi:hypothetical protein